MYNTAFIPNWEQIQRDFDLDSDLLSFGFELDSKENPEQVRAEDVSFN